MAKLSLAYPDLLKHVGAYAVNQRTESRQFLAWFLNNYYRLEESDVDDAICDGSDDKGVDGIYVAEQSSEIHVFQSRIVKGPKTLGDTGLKEFWGSLSQFRTKANVENISASTKNQDLRNLLLDLEIAEKVEKGYVVRGVFVTNAKRDGSATSFLKTSSDLILYDEIELVKSFVPIDKTEPIADEISFDVSGVSILEYPITSTVKMVLAPVAAAELVKMEGIKNGELFSYNVRQWLKKTKVNDDIATSIKSQDEHKFFPAFHNGITVLCKKLVPSKDKVTISGYVVVNGCQSLSGLFENKAKISSDLRLVVRFVQTEPDGPLATKITDHTNNQNGTTARDLQSNNLIQTRLQTEINGKGEFCYRVKRGEHLEWEGDKVIENQLAARILLAFDVKEPWSCHQTYKLFGEAYSAIFSRLEVTGDRVVALYRLYQLVLKKLKLIDNQLFAQYTLTHFFLLYMLREALETDALGKKFCADPAPFVSSRKDSANLLSCMDKIAQAVVRVVNQEVNRREALADPKLRFDFKRDLKSPAKIRDLKTSIITTYQVLIDNEAAKPFGKMWTAKG